MAAPYPGAVNTDRIIAYAALVIAFVAWCATRALIPLIGFLPASVIFYLMRHVVLRADFSVRGWINGAVIAAVVCVAM